MTQIALRQIATAARDLDRALEDLRAVFGVEVAHVDPGIAQFGLTHAVLAFGTSQFFEVVSPFEDKAPAARFLQDHDQRGYMLIFQADSDDRAAIRDRARERGYREIFNHDEDGYSCLQWHPRDIGPTMLEVDAHIDDDLAGVWWPAGNSRGDGGSSHVERVTGALLLSGQPDADARQWADLLDVPLTERDGDHVLSIADGEVVIRQAPDGVEPGLVEITVAPRNAAAIRKSASQRGLLTEDGAVDVAGIRIRLG